VIRACLVAGTHGWNGTTDPLQARNCWWWPGSAFTQMLERHGIALVSRTRPFVWSTDLEGEPGEVAHRDWRAGGIGLYAYLVPDLCPDRRVPPAETLVITHSHGLQVALYAFAEGLQGSLISVCGPVRDDMMAVATRARPNLRCWLQLHSDDSDAWQILGADWLGAIAGVFRRSDATDLVSRKHPLADSNVFVPDVGHTGLLDEPSTFDRWDAPLAELAERLEASAKEGVV
jgi:hypothetical protein